MVDSIQYSSKAEQGDVLIKKVYAILQDSDPIMPHIPSWWPKVISIICLAFTAIGLLDIGAHPARGYEISIYSNTPASAFALLITSTVVSIGIIVNKAFSKESEDSWSLLAFYTVMLNNFIFLSLYALRGYLYYASPDYMIHLRNIDDIIKNGYIPDNNYYPLLHLFVSESSIVSEIYFVDLARYVPGILSIILIMLFTYLMVRSLIPERNVIALTSAAIAPMFFNNLQVQLYPHTLSVMMYPIIFYLYFKYTNHRSWQNSMLLILVLLILPYSHPSGALSILIILIFLEISKIAYNWRYGTNSINPIFIAPMFCSFIILIMWISSFKLFDVGISNVANYIFEPVKSNEVLATYAKISALGFEDVLHYNLFMYGDTITSLILSFLGIIYILILYRNKQPLIINIFLLSIAFLVFIPIEYFFFIGVKGQTTGRLLNLLYLIIPSPILSSYYLSRFKHNNKKTMIWLLFSFIAIISIFSLYHSPLTFTASWHVTRMDIDGFSWFSDNRDPLLKFDPMAFPFTIENYKWGLIPEHFNYLNRSKLRDSIPENSYALINERCKLMNLDRMIFKARLNIRSGWGFNNGDFHKLMEDDSVQKLYSNGEFDTYIIS